MKLALYLVAGLAVYMLIFRRAPASMPISQTPGVKGSDVPNPLSAPSICPPGFIESMGKGRVKCVPVGDGILMPVF